MRSRLTPIVLALIAIAIAFRDSITPAESAGTTNPRLGIVEAYNAPNSAAASGAGWQRVRFQWSLIQPNGPEDWGPGEITDAQIRREVAAGRMPVGLLITTPAWAMEGPGIPRGLYLPEDDPNNTWAVFVRTIVTRYKGKIDHWIIWNEPDVWDEAHPGFTWPGSVDDFVQLTKVAYITAKAANPSAVIHLSGFTHYWDANYGRDLYFRRYLDSLVYGPWGAAEHNFYFDVASLHLYFDPEANHDLIRLYRQIMLDHGLDKPLWIVETNAAPSADPAWSVPDARFAITLEEQSHFMPQMLAMGLAAGAERLAVYKMMDARPEVTADPEPFGLVRLNGTRRPAFTTFTVASRMLNDAASATLVERDSWARILILKPNRAVHVLWARWPGGAVATFPAQGKNAQVYSETGRWLGRIVPSAGMYTVALDGPVCSNNPCIIGGPVEYVVETLK